MHRRNRLALLTVMTAAALTAPVTPVAAASPPAAPEPRPVAVAAPHGEVLNVAHRGASAYAPENTMAAFRLAKAQGADMFELDVQETKDHKLVVMHDTTLARTTNVEQVYPGRAPWKVSDFTLAEIRKLDAGSWFSEEYKGERIPTLNGVLRAMRGEGLGMLLEVKSPGLYPGIEKRIARTLRRSPSWLRHDPYKQNMVVQSFDWDSVHRFHELMPEVPTGLIGTPKEDEFRKFSSYADQINPRHTDLTQSYVDGVHKAQMDILTWTVNDRGDMEKAVSLGVDGIITDRPDVLRRVLSAAQQVDAAA